MASVYMVLKLSGKYKTVREESEENKAHCFSMMARRLFIDAPYTVNNVEGMTVNNRGEIINGITVNQYDENTIDVLVSYEYKKMHPNTIEENKSNTFQLGEITIRHNLSNEVAIVPENTSLTFCATKKDLTKLLTDEIGKDGAKQHSNHGVKLKIIDKFAAFDAERLRSEKIFKEEFFEDKNFLQVLISEAEEYENEEAAMEYTAILNGL